jgi:hypothetical protein
MAETPEEKRPDLLQLLEEVDRLEEAQRALDLRDPSAVEDHQRKIDELRRRIAQLQP